MAENLVIRFESTEPGAEGESFEIHIPRTDFRPDEWQTVQTVLASPHAGNVRIENFKPVKYG